MEAHYVIVGSGFFGAVCAERLASAGRKVLVIEKRDHIGGNSWSEPDPETGIEVHKYGSHIFHTAARKVWEYLSRFTKFNDYRHTVWTTYKGRVYSMPINLATINNFYGLNLKPGDVVAFLRKERGKETYAKPANLEEQAISLLGRPLYEAFIQGYTMKQWGKAPKDLPPEIITRLPVRNNYNNRYFDDPYQGIPLEGYGKLFKRILDHPNVTVQLCTDWFKLRDQLQGKRPLIYTGPIDQFFDYKYGRLEWRSLEFEREVHPIPDFQGCAVMNYAEPEAPFTRIHEFKHYHPERRGTAKTVIFKEYPRSGGRTSEPYYPVNTARNAELLARYGEKACLLENIWFGGRLGTYQYMDMDDAVGAALDLAENLSSLEQTCCLGLACP